METKSNRTSEVVMKPYPPTYVGDHRAADLAVRPGRSYKPRHSALQVPPAVVEFRQLLCLPPIEARS